MPSPISTELNGITTSVFVRNSRDLSVQIKPIVNQQVWELKFKCTLIRGIQISTGYSAINKLQILHELKH